MPRLLDAIRAGMSESLNKIIEEATVYDKFVAEQQVRKALLNTLRISIDAELQAIPGITFEPRDSEDSRYDWNGVVRFPTVDLLQMLIQVEPFDRTYIYESNPNSKTYEAYRLKLYFRRIGPGNSGQWLDVNLLSTEHDVSTKSLEDARNVAEEHIQQQVVDSLARGPDPLKIADYKLLLSELIEFKAEEETPDFTEVPSRARRLIRN